MFSPLDPQLIILSNHIQIAPLQIQWEKPFIKPLLQEPNILIDIMVKKADTKPPPPKRPQSSFFLYRTEQYSVVHAAKPDLKATQITSIIGEQWKKLEEKEKQKYVDLYSKNKEQYEKDKKAYEEKHGKIERKSKKNKKAKAAKKGKEESEEEDEDDEE